MTNNRDDTDAEKVEIAAAIAASELATQFAQLLYDRGVPRYSSVVQQCIAAVLKKEGYAR